MPNRRTIISGLAALALAPTAAAAALRRYALDARASEVAFSFTLNGIAQRGRIPVLAADIRIDPAHLDATRADITLDARRAEAALGFATAALRGPGILDAARHPQIRFRSRSVTLGPGGRLSDGARIAGALTLRGITRPVTLQAALYRARGAAPADLSRLEVRLSGSLSRSAFGATGYADLVGDRVGLDIRARLQAP